MDITILMISATIEIISALIGNINELLIKSRGILSMDNTANFLSIVAIVIAAASLIIPTILTYKINAKNLKIESSKIKYDLIYLPYIVKLMEVLNDNGLKSPPFFILTDKERNEFKDILFENFKYLDSKSAGLAAEFLWNYNILHILGDNASHKSKMKWEKTFIEMSNSIINQSKLISNEIGLNDITSSINSSETSISLKFLDEL